MNDEPNCGLLDLKQLEELLGSFSKATGLRIEAVDQNGKTFSIPGNLERCKFCSFIRDKLGAERKCQDSYKRAGLEAAKWQEPYFFRCHAGLVIWAVPIIINGLSLGCIICGQVLMWKADAFFYQELKKFGLNEKDYAELKDHADNLEVILPEQSQAAADMLHVVVNNLLKRNMYHLEQMAALRVQRDQIRKIIEERKNGQSDSISNLDSYLKKERAFLRYIRLGDKARAFSTLQNLLANIDRATLLNKRSIKVRIMDLATLSSRAAVEGGAKAERIMQILDNFYQEIESVEEKELYFLKISQVVETFMAEILLLAEKKHFSTIFDARNFIMENFSCSLTIKDIADHLFISPSHLSRLFRDQLDSTVNDYVTRVRIEQAVELLKRPEFTVAQVAKTVGFINQSYFAKIFRKYIGVTPLTYKNSLF